MISVLIPSFNRDVNELVNDLSCQVASTSSKVEIIVLDDGSEVSFRRLNKKLIGIPYVQYKETGKNNGRIRIRQMLAEMASFDWLLFLDCDSKIISDQFLDSFCRRISSSNDVTVGGRLYSLKTPEDCRFRLHWKYGTRREKIHSQNINGHKNRFMTNNFFIKKSFSGA